MPWKPQKSDLKLKRIFCENLVVKGLEELRCTCTHDCIHMIVCQDILE